MQHPLWRGICPECVGFGRIGEARCGYCRGTGKLFRQIPHDNEHLRLLRRKKKPLGLASNVDGKRVSEESAEDVA